MNEVTARKWRPQLFKDFVGQDYVVHSLKQSIKESKIAHGYLFSGPRGIGKTSTARVLATALNCLNLSTEVEPCLKCKNCIEIRQGNSPDVIEIDGASNRGIDDMREMRSNIQFMPSYSRYKIYIIDEVHMLTTEAFNSILKVLEEPPSYLVFMFATTEIHKVKSTIRSRCQQFYLKRLTEDQIAQQLVKILTAYYIDYEAEALKLIAKSADGSMRDSQSILDQAIVFSQGTITIEKIKEILGVTSYSQLTQFLHIIIKEDAGAMKQFAQDLYIKGDDLSFFVLQLIEVLRHLLLIEYKVSDSLDLEQELKQELTHIASFFNKYQLQTLIDLFMAVFKEMKDTDHEYFLLEGTFLKALQYKQFVNLKDIIDRLSYLEAQTSELPLEEEQNTMPSSVTIKPPIDKNNIFREWKNSILTPREKKIILDIKTSSLEQEILKIEFLTQEGLERFKEHESLQQELKKYYQDKGLTLIKVEPFIEKVFLKPDSIKSNIKEQSEDLLSVFMSELNAKPIKED